ncbi:hypothetical protein BJY01DRAFT_251172 [Aspergillus pseudoustus]|uniref:Uncharacterized protein n=1 Tax=Aspergillus pseudoustus TaxID=1810923 RepID=A0ABR4JFM2_9EURO
MSERSGYQPWRPNMISPISPISFDARHTESLNPVSSILSDGRHSTNPRSAPLALSPRLKLATLPPSDTDSDTLSSRGSPVLVGVSLLTTPSAILHSDAAPPTPFDLRVWNPPPRHTSAAPSSPRTTVMSPPPQYSAIFPTDTPVGSRPPRSYCRTLDPYHVLSRRATEFEQHVAETQVELAQRQPSGFARVFGFISRNRDPQRPDIY